MDFAPFWVARNLVSDTGQFLGSFRNQVPYYRTALMGTWYLGNWVPLVDTLNQTAFKSNGLLVCLRKLTRALIIVKAMRWLKFNCKISKFVEKNSLITKISKFIHDIRTSQFLDADQNNGNCTSWCWFPDQIEVICHCVSNEEKQQLLDARQSLNTRNQTKSHLKILGDFLSENSKPKLYEITDADLPDILFDFYTGVHREDGDMYKLATIKCIRASINRHMKEKCNLDIIQDPHFIKANEMFRAITVESKHQGKAVTVSKRVIKSKDMHLLSEYFNNCYEDNPDQFSSSRIAYSTSCISSSDVEEKISQICNAPGSKFLRTARLASSLWNKCRMSWTRTTAQKVPKSQMKGACMKSQVRNRTVIKLWYSCMEKNLFNCKTQNVNSVPGFPMCPVKVFQLYISKLDLRCPALW